jgi:ATP-dependent exoDNAse (exonuclease V) beta subunit
MHHQELGLLLILRLLLNRENNISKKIITHNLKKLGSDIEIEEIIENIAEQRLVSYNCMELIINKFKLNNCASEYVYLQTLLDICLNFSLRNSSSIEDFVEYWDVESHKFNIQIPENQNAIRLLTIHKSKGLEYKAVFIPYCNWKFEDSTGLKAKTYWLESKVEKLNEISHYPIEFNKNLLKTTYKDEYLKYWVKEHIEALNMLYVATTRPKESMFIYYPEAEKIGAVNYLFSIMDKSKFKQNKGLRYFGEIETVITKSEKENIDILQDFKSVEFDSRIALKTQNEFLESNEQLINGKLYHDIFSEILYFKDIDKVCETYYQKAQIDDAKRFSKEIKQKISKHSQMKEWFSEDWEIKTESTILTKNYAEKRPDRVMIKGDQFVILDYKFGKPEMKHYFQVRSYMKLIKDMGFDKVAGYLWYYDDNILEGV